MVTAIRAHARRSHGAPDVALVDVERPLRNALANLEFTIAKAGATVTSDPMPSVAVDVEQGTKVFPNLISNAVRFRSDKLPAQIHVSARETDRE